MNYGPVTKLDKRNKTTSKTFDDDVMSENCDVIVIFRIFGQFGGFQRPGILDTEPAKVMFSVIVTFCNTQTENRTKNSNTALTLLL